MPIKGPADVLRQFNANGTKALVGMRNDHIVVIAYLLEDSPLKVVEVWLSSFLGE